MQRISDITGGIHRPKPFDQEVIVPIMEWKEMPNSPSLIRRWNMRMGLMERVMPQGVEIPTRLPYRAVDKNPDLMSVDAIYHAMLQFEQAHQVFSPKA